MLKKFFALLLCATLLLCLLVGCNKQNADNTAETTQFTIENIYEDSTPAGTLYLTFGAAIEIVYNDEGEAIQITGKNEVGNTIANACQSQLGKECVFAARAILRYASDNKLLADAKTVAVRVGKDEVPPSDDFLDTIITDCQYLADEECTGLKMVKIGEDRLTESGELNEEIARRLASYFLEVPEEDLFGDDEPVEGGYTLSGNGKKCLVDAFTGMVTTK